jgi:hypothetical protein
MASLQEQFLNKQMKVIFIYSSFSDNAFSCPVRLSGVVFESKVKRSRRTEQKTTGGEQHQSLQISSNAGGITHRLANLFLHTSVVVKPAIITS